MGHLSFTDILDTSLKVSWKEPLEKNGILTGIRLGLCNYTVLDVSSLLICGHGDSYVQLGIRPSCRLPHLLGGVQQDQYSGHPLFAQPDSGIQGDGAHSPHHLHHPGSSHDLQGTGAALILHYLLWCSARSVNGTTSFYYLLYYIIYIHVFQEFCTIYIYI